MSQKKQAPALVDATARKTVHVVSLGCPKNRVDSEVMLGHLAQDGYVAVDSPEGADLILVNTCAFIDAAKEESVDAILDMAQYKGDKPGQKLVVAGCLSQRYAPDLAKEIPEVDHFLGTGNFETIRHVLAPAVATTPKGRKSLPILAPAQAPALTPSPSPKPHPRLVGRNRLVPFRHTPEAGAARPVAVPDPDFTITAESPRLATLPPFTTYVKISEGCSNDCAFCIIPKLRGPQRSRPIDDIVREVERAILGGAVELNLIAQDLCAYGKDLAPKTSLARLLRRLDATAAQAGRPVWIRCLYLYPRGLTQEVIDVVADAKCIVPYLDLPLQHIADSLLVRMRRGKGGEATKSLVRRLRRDIPSLTLRTTFITGMPGETEGDFAELCDFVEEVRFERLGVFPYSREEDTPAATMAAQVDAAVARARQARLMELQQRISQEQQGALVGQTLTVLVEGVAKETELLLQGRHAGQAPDIDGVTYINDGTANPGDFVAVRIEEAGEYDLAGGIVSGAIVTPIEARLV